MGIRNFTVPCWELNLDAATATINIVDGDLVGVKDVSTDTAANTFEIGGDIILKLTSAQACTVTVANKTAAIGSLDGTALAATSGTTTVSLTANTPKVVTIAKNTIVA